MSQGIKFVICPECKIGIGQRGLARHLEQTHDVPPAVAKKRAKRTAW